MSNWYDKFVAQAKADYIGTPIRILRTTDQYGEVHIIIESRLKGEKSKLYLDWIGGELANWPDEFYGEPPMADRVWDQVWELIK